MRIKLVQNTIDKLRNKKYSDNGCLQVSLGGALIDKFIVDTLKLKGFETDRNSKIVKAPDGLSFDISFQPYVLYEQYMKNDYFFPKTNKKILAFDMGMNAGFVSLKLANMENVEAVYSFEPFENTYKLALNNFELNPKIKNKIHPHLFGLSNKNSEVTSYYQEGLAGNMSLVHNNYDGQSEVFKKENAEMQTVKIKDASEVMKDIIDKYPNNLVLVKCDTEGSEFEIFESLYKSKLLSKIDFVMMEYHYRDVKILENYLLDFGFFVLNNDDNIMLYAMKYAK